MEAYRTNDQTARVRELESQVSELLAKLDRRTSREEWWSEYGRLVKYALVAFGAVVVAMGLGLAGYGVHVSGSGLLHAIVIPAIAVTGVAALFLGMYLISQIADGHL